MTPKELSADNSFGAEFITLAMAESPCSPGIAGVIEAIGSLSKELASTESQRLKFYARAVVVAHRPRSPTTAGVIDASGCDCEDFIIFIIIEKIIKFSG